MGTSSELVIEGRLDGRTVSATWWNGTITGDDELVEAVHRIVASGVTVTNGGRSHRASLRNIHGAAIALIRAVDGTGSMQISLQPRQR